MASRGIQALFYLSIHCAMVAANGESGNVNVKHTIYTVVLLKLHDLFVLNETKGQRSVMCHITDSPHIVTCAQIRMLVLISSFHGVCLAKSWGISDVWWRLSFMGASSFPWKKWRPVMVRLCWESRGNIAMHITLPFQHDCLRPIDTKCKVYGYRHCCFLFYMHTSICVHKMVWFSVQDQWPSTTYH